MAERRMFAKSITSSARFLRMPISSRLLYYDLGMVADDDGVVEAFTVLRVSGAAEDDLRVLASKNFIRILNDDLVSVILDWKQNNQIRPDRYKPSIYADLLKGLHLGLPDDNQLVNQMTTKTGTNGKPSIGKDRIAEDRPEEGSKEECSSPPLPDAGEVLQNAFSEWLSYKQERKEGYKPTGLKALQTEVMNNARKHGEESVSLLIRHCMANGWKGIIFELLTKDGGRFKQNVLVDEPKRNKADDDFLAFLAESGVEV